MVGWNFSPSLVKFGKFEEVNHLSFHCVERKLRPRRGMSQHWGCTEAPAGSVSSSGPWARPPQSPTVPSQDRQPGTHGGFCLCDGP